MIYRGVDLRSCSKTKQKYCTHRNRRGWGCFICNYL